MQKISKFAKFVYSEDDEDLIAALSSYLDSNADKVLDFFNVLHNELVTIRIIKTKHEYDQRFKKQHKLNYEVPKWNVGNFNVNLEIEYVSLHDYKNTSHKHILENYSNALDYYKKTILHEYIHFVTYLYCKENNVDYPIKYLSEGVAQYLSGQRDNMVLNFNSTLEEILNSENCYYGWFMLTKYIIEKHGKSFFMNMIKDRNYALTQTSKLYEEATQFYKMEETHEHKI